MCQRFTLEKKWNKDQECTTKERPCGFISYVSHVAIFNRSCHVRTWITFKFFHNATIYMLHVVASQSRRGRALHLILMIIWHCSLCVHSVQIFCISCSSFSSSPSTFKVHTHTHSKARVPTCLHPPHLSFSAVAARAAPHAIDPFPWLIAVAEGFLSLFLTFKRALICTSQHFCARLHKGIHTHTHARAWAQTHRLYLLVCVFVQSSVETSCSLVKQLTVIPVHIVHYVGS